MTKLSNPERLAWIIKMARAAGWKLTPQRLKIFELVAGSCKHPGADDIYQELVKTMPTISLDTIYRTLRSMSELGLLHVLAPHRENLRFDPNLAHHHHFICTLCGSIMDFESSALDLIPIPHEASNLGESNTLHVEIRGVCRQCLTAGDTITK